MGQSIVVQPLQGPSWPNPIITAEARPLLGLFTYPVMALVGQFGGRSKSSGFMGEADVQRTCSDLPRMTQSSRCRSGFAVGRPPAVN